MWQRSHAHMLITLDADNPTLVSIECMAFSPVFVVQGIACMLELKIQYYKVYSSRDSRQLASNSRAWDPHFPLASVHWHFQSFPPHYNRLLPTLTVSVPLPPLFPFPLPWDPPQSESLPTLHTRTLHYSSSFLLLPLFPPSMEVLTSMPPSLPSLSPTPTLIPSTTPPLPLPLLLCTDW